MAFKKSLSFVLILSQMAVASASFGDSTATTVTPEISLISSVIALQGQKLSGAELQKQITGQIAQYAATAPLDGRLERAQQALVGLGVFTPAQAQDFGTQIQAVSQKIASTKFASAEEAQQALSSQLMDVATRSSGAQFSSCDVAIGFYAVGIAAFAGGLTGSIIVNWNNLVNGDGSFQKDLWMADAGIAGVFVALIGTFISADGECFE